MKRALIVGITGQDGSYLSELLLSQGYEVHGVVRRSSTLGTQRIDHLDPEPHASGSRLLLHYGDLADGASLRRVLELAVPDEVYNLGAQSHVQVSFEQPEYTADCIATGTLRLLEAVREHVAASKRDVRFFQASTSEMFGGTPPPQSEGSPFQPRSPYAASKLAAHWYVRSYREAYGLYAVSGILFNHESPRRGLTFVSRKITRAVGRISLGLQDKLYLGNLEARRDWGFAGDYVVAMQKMLEQREPTDLVIATGESHSVRELMETAFEMTGLDWHRYVEIDPRFFRPAEADHLCGDARKARELLDWEPRVRFIDLVRMMVDADTELARKEAEQSSRIERSDPQRRRDAERR